MKKLFLTLIAIAATSVASFADTTLAEAYKSLAGMSGMKEVEFDSKAIDDNVTFTNIATSSVMASQADVESYRAGFIYELENLPVRNMIIGANNMREIAAVYATPAANGKYDVLIIQGNALNGSFQASYGQTTKAGINAIRSSQLSMDADALVFTPANGDASSSFLGMND